MLKALNGYKTLKIMLRARKFVNILQKIQDGARTPCLRVARVVTVLAVFVCQLR